MRECVPCLELGHPKPLAPGLCQAFQKNDLLAALDEEFIREDHHCDSFFPFGGLRFGLGVDLVMALIDR